MAWEIKVWHEQAGDRMRLLIEASVQVPEDVISHLSSVYWSEEIQGFDDEWEEAGPYDSRPNSRIQG